mgnify:CR=1 FL=1
MKRDIDIEVDGVLLEDLERREFIVVAPAVFTEQAAHVEALAADFQADWREQFLWCRAEFARELLQAEEMACIVKFAVIRHQCLDRIGIRHIVRLHKLAVLRDEESIVFAHAAVVVLLLPIDCHVAEHDGDAMRGSDDVLSIALAVAQESRLFPGISQEITGDGHLGEDDDIGVVFASLADEGEDALRVLVGMARNDLHLCHGNVQQIQHPFRVHNDYKSVLYNEIYSYLCNKN